MELCVKVKSSHAVHVYDPHHVSELRVLLQELHYTVGQLGLVLHQRFGLVQWDQHLGQELPMLWLEWQGKAVDDAAQNLQQLCNTVELLSLVDEPVAM